VTRNNYLIKERKGGRGQTTLSVFAFRERPRFGWEKKKKEKGGKEGGGGERRMHQTRESSDTAQEIPGALKMDK